MADYGLIGGLGQGLQKGLMMYMQKKQMDRDNQIQNLTSGVQQDENGNLQLNPIKQQQQQFAGAQAKHGMDNEDASTTVSQSKRNVAKGLLNAQQPGLGDQTIKDEMSGADVDQLGGLIKPTIMGGYNVQAANAKAGGAVKAAQIGATAKTDVADKNNAGKAAKGDAANIYKYSGIVSHDAQLNNATAASDSADKMTALLNTNESPSILMGKIQALRAAGLNRVTNFEIGSFNGDQSAMGRANQALETLQSGDLTEGNIGEFKNAVKVLKDSAEKTKSSRQQFLTNLGNKVGIDKDTQQGFINPQAAQQSQGPAPQQGLVGQPDPKIAQYAQQNGLDYAHAQTILTQRGYKSGQ